MHHDLSIFDIVTDEPILGAQVNLYSFDYTSINALLTAGELEAYNTAFELIYTC